MTLSALAPEADIRHRIEHVCFVPIADINHHLFSAVVIALIRLFQLRDEIPFLFIFFVLLHLAGISPSNGAMDRAIDARLRWLDCNSPKEGSNERHAFERVYH